MHLVFSKHVISALFHFDIADLLCCEISNYTICGFMVRVKMNMSLYRCGMRGVVVELVFVVLEAGDYVQVYI